MARIKELQGAWAEQKFYTYSYLRHMLCILSYGARPLKKETDVERKYTLALFPESSDWTKAEVTPRRIRLISAVVRANLFPLFFLA